MSNFNQNVEDALSQDDEEFLRRLDDEPGLFVQMGNAFQERLKYWTAYAFIMSLMLFGGAVYCFWQLLQTDNARDAILWATGVWWGFLAVGLIKIWFWMRMNHLAVLREIKRVELHLVRGAV